MGNKLSRRKFFLAAAGKSSTDNIDDTLFKKYSRKRGGSRSYSTEMRQITPVELEGNDIRVPNVTSGLAPYNGTWSTWEVLHLLRRTHFGWKKSWVDALQAMAPAAAVDTLVQSTPLPAPPINN